MAKYIDQSAAITRLTHLEVTKPTATMTNAKRALADMFPADVEPVRHGRWLWDTEDIYRCTVCNEKSHVKEVMCSPAWDYCPHCGAKMDGGEAR